MAPYFVPYVLASLLTHVAEVVANAVLAYALFQDVQHKALFFPLVAGILVIPLVAIQLLSAVFLLRHRGDSMSAGEVLLMAVLHVLQLGFIWRHLDVIHHRDLASRKNSLSELFVLRLIYTFAAGVPLMLVQVYLLLSGVTLYWPPSLYVSLVTSFISTTWTLASFRRSSEASESEESMMSWPGSLVRILWRAGEIVSRIISLSLFASLYKDWLFLVLGFHWLAMLACITVPQVLSGELGESSRLQRGLFCAVTSYCYMFCYINFCVDRSIVWYTLYYIIMFLENGTLSIIWLMRSNKDSFAPSYLLVFISALAFVAAMVCLVVYYKFFHFAADTTESTASKQGVSTRENRHGTCSQCRLSLCAEHQTRPLNFRWLSHYQSSVLHGQLSKRAATQDSLLGSISDSTSVAAGSAEHRLCHHLAVDNEASESNCSCLHQSIGDEERTVKCHCSQSSERCCNKRSVNSSRSGLTDKTSVISLEGIVSQAMVCEHTVQPNRVPVWLPSDESIIVEQLFTDTWDNLSEEMMKERRQKEETNLVQCHSVLAQEAQKWLGDGDSSDQTTLDWLKLPAPVTGKDIWNRHDGGSDCCACHCSEYSPRDSEVSSIFRASQKMPALGQSLASSGCEVACSIHRGANHCHHRARRKELSFPDSEMACACCLQQQECCRQSQHKIFIVSKHRSHSTPVSCDHEKHKKESTRSSPTRAKEKMPSEGAFSKTKKSDERKTRKITEGKNKSCSELKKDECPTNLESQHKIKDVEKTGGDNIAKIKHVPKKLQATVLAQKLDKEVDKLSVSSEPQYENLWICTMNSKDSGHSVSLAQISEDRSPDFVQKPDPSVGPQVELCSDYAETIKPLRSRDIRGSSAYRPDAYWYSESEDSALPPETFSSSNDCFSTSDAETENSFELVI